MLDLGGVLLIRVDDSAKLGRAGRAIGHHEVIEEDWWEA